MKVNKTSRARRLSTAKRPPEQPSPSLHPPPHETAWSSRKPYNNTKKESWGIAAEVGTEQTSAIILVRDAEKGAPRSRPSGTACLILRGVTSLYDSRTQLCYMISLCEKFAILVSLTKTTRLTQD